MRAALPAIRAPGLYATQDRFVLKILFASLSISDNGCQPFGLTTRLVRHSCRSKYDTDLDQVEYITLPGSLTLSLFYVHTQPLPLSCAHTHTHRGMHATGAELTYGPLVLRPHWLTCATPLRRIEESILLFFLNVRHASVSMAHIVWLCISADGERNGSGSLIVPVALGLKDAPPEGLFFFPNKDTSRKYAILRVRQIRAERALQPWITQAPLLSCGYIISQWVHR